MPIYEYACRACDHAFETMQKASESPLEDCPECGEPQLKKLLSAPVFRLKGSGWYETDFKSGDKKRNLAGETATGDAKSDSAAKPAADAASNGSGGGKAASDGGSKAASDGGGKSSGASSSASKATT
ncbi:MAG: zinc ribbon domain-containing protein [Gammaproteobacteria bacterium]|nr:zinc ribbon domain-containing protein [Gammaproteobacteria bacterium]MYB38282.1 zinc ribbon domain-containing protein [Gammaproteobacteria bacterium]